MDLRPLDQIARTHHGLVTRAQLLQLGWSAWQCRAAVQRGELVALAPKVYRLAGTPTTRMQRILAACLATGGVASHATAAALHGLGAGPPEGPIEVLVQRTSSPRKPSPLATVHTTTSLTADDVLDVTGIPTTSVARTILLLAGRPGARVEELGTIVDEAIRTGTASDAWLWWRLEQLRRRGRGGVLTLERVLIERSQHPTESWLEREFLLVMDRFGVPRPRCQARIAAQGAFVARVDFIDEEVSLIIEVNGHAHHASREQLATDAARRARLQLAGYRVLDFTYDQVVRQPDWVARTVHEARRLRPAS